MSESIRTRRATSKVALAEQIFAQMAGYPRSAVVKRFEQELDLTKAGSSTYYQSMRKQFGLVNSGS